MRPLVVAALAALMGCALSRSLVPQGPISGTWGGANAGLIATDSSAHVHIGCTLGDTKGVIQLDSAGRFDATGTYDVDAFPVARGILHPARFSGTVIGNTMTLTVTLTDTSRTLGPVTLVLGADPRMGPCPICRMPGEANVRRRSAL